MRYKILYSPLASLAYFLVPLLRAKGTGIITKVVLVGSLCGLINLEIQILRFCRDIWTAGERAVKMVPHASLRYAGYGAVEEESFV
jgi:hypothetical protein